MPAPSSSLVVCLALLAVAASSAGCVLGASEDPGCFMRRTDGEAPPEGWRVLNLTEAFLGERPLLDASTAHHEAEVRLSCPRGEAALSDLAAAGAEVEVTGGSDWTWLSRDGAVFRLTVGLWLDGF